MKKDLINKSNSGKTVVEVLAPEGFEIRIIPPTATWQDEETGEWRTCDKWCVDDLGGNLREYNSLEELLIDWGLE